MMTNIHPSRRCTLRDQRKKISAASKRKKDPFHYFDPKSFILTMLALCFLVAMFAYLQHSFLTMEQQHHLSLLDP